MADISEEIVQKSFENIKQEVIVNLMFVSQKVRSVLEELCQSEEITLSQFNILRILKGIYPNAHPRSEIRKRMIDKSDVTRLIDRLETRGLVKRISGEHDKRHSLTIITSDGMILIERLSKKFPDAHEDILKNFAPMELIELVKLMKKFT